MNFRQRTRHNAKVPYGSPKENGSMSSPSDQDCRASSNARRATKTTSPTLPAKWTGSMTSWPPWSNRSGPMAEGRPHEPSSHRRQQSCRADACRLAGGKSAVRNSRRIQGGQADARSELAHVGDADGRSTAIALAWSEASAERLEADFPGCAQARGPHRPQSRGDRLRQSRPLVLRSDQGGNGRFNGAYQRIRRPAWCQVPRSERGGSMTRVRISPTKRAEIFRDCDERCHLCGGRIDVGQKWDVEHVIPLAMGGADDITNWRPAHTKCHKGKT